MNVWALKQTGFTIVELLIVIVVVGVLATITVTAYNGVQERARDAKIQNDLTQLEKAISIARIQTGKTLYGVTEEPAPTTASPCIGQASGTDIGGLPATHDCWVFYASSLDKISEASGINVRNLLDPWGRPYLIYESEGKGTPPACTQDWVAALQYPHVNWSPYDLRRLPNSMTTCP